MQFFGIKREKRKVCDSQAALTLCASASNYTLKSTKCFSDRNAVQPHLDQTLRTRTLLFPLLPTHWQVVFKALCLIHKYLHGAGQRCLSEVLPAATWAAFQAQTGTYLISSAPHSHWCQEQNGKKEENELKKEVKRKEIEKRVGSKGNVKRGRGWKLIIIINNIILLM